MVAQYIDMQSLLDLCEATERSPGARVGRQWWEQADIDLTGTRETAAAAAAAEADEDDMEK